MSYNSDNRPAQTLNEPTRRPQLTELLQTTRLCGATLSVYGTPAEPLFKAKEVADILGLTNPSDLIQRVDEDERAKFNLGRQGETWLLTEHGLYEVLMQSRKPVARQFKAGVKALLRRLRTGASVVTPRLPMAEPLAGIEPIILRGRAWYPLRDLLRRLTGAKYAKIDHYTSRYPDRTMVYYQMTYCDTTLARYIAAREELRERQEALSAPLFDIDDAKPATTSDVALDPRCVTIRF